MPQPTKNNYNNKNVHPLSLIKFCVLFGMLLNVLQHPRAVKATDDVANVSPCELESIINQLVYPSPQYQMHAASLRNQLRNILRERQLEEGEEQSLNNDMDYMEEDKRSVAALAAQGLLHHSNNNNNNNAAAAAAKRSLATLAKNGQLPTPDPEILGDSEQSNQDKRYVGSLARSGNLMGYGKRNIGTLARDFQLPQNGKRNLATMARLGWLGNRNEPKRNLASVARYNSRMLNNAEKRNIGALKGSPVHGVQQKRGEDDVYLPAEYNNYMDPLAYYWNYATYADLDWDDYGRAQKRFLDTSKNPELFGIEHGHLWSNPDEDEGEEVAPLPVTHLPDEAGDSNNIDEDESVVDDDMLPEEAAGEQYSLPTKRHIGAVYRSGFLPSYRALRSTTGSGVGGGRFSRSGRARQFV
ncbi:neuropeptide-like precursor 1 isoform 2-T3 [Cochliomyia hominivorax]